jgi:hypothetical protein
VRGDVKVKDALADARALGVRDLHERYAPSKTGERRQGTSITDEPLRAEDEPERIKCEHCGSWYTPNGDKPA